MSNWARSRDVRGLMVFASVWHEIDGSVYSLLVRSPSLERTIDFLMVLLLMAPRQEGDFCAVYRLTFLSCWTVCRLVTDLLEGFVAVPKSALWLRRAWFLLG
mmetsp:Transcript_52467/g.169207  ORF Transcript_52467/g.169207 Transcript_52467/m.169207 type:complete len:102 (-) Transcript_52467:36-341(-)